jgi:hypothetical protein
VFVNAVETSVRNTNTAGPPSRPLRTPFRASLERYSLILTSTRRDAVLSTRLFDFSLGSPSRPPPTNQPWSRHGQFT